MIKRLKDFFFGIPPAEMKQMVSVDGVGNFALSDDWDFWECKLQLNSDNNITISVVGDREPNNKILELIVDRFSGASKTQFFNDFQQFLKTESQTKSKYKEEILTLKIRRIDFLWTDKPNQALVDLYTECSCNCRGWRCSYDLLNFSNLGYDSL